MDRANLELLRKQLVTAYENVPFYRKAFDKRSLKPSRFKCGDDLRDYPIITKSDIQACERGFLSVRYASASLQKSHSSGSTGQPLWTYYDFKSWLRKKYLVKLRARYQTGLRLREKIAIFSTDQAEKLSKENRRTVSRSLFMYRYFSIFDDPGKSLSELTLWRPENMDGIPSHLFRLAHVMDEYRIKLDSVKRIFTSSEYLEPNMRHYIEERYGAEVFDIYGCTEMKEIAWECDRHDGYHINEDEVYVEVMNGTKPSEPGEIGDLVLTDLRNRAMPLIRYQVGDRGMLLAGPCGCGRISARMAPAAGRASDYLTTPDGRQLSPYLFTTAIEKMKGLLQYQFVQNVDHSLTVKVIMDHPVRRDEKAQIQAIISPFLGDGAKIDVTECDAIDIEENGKYKVVKRRAN